ncbi:MAG: hypothetical protein ACLP9S_03275 [Syntrophales bacterium]|jgi:hypothetical protein
MLDDSKSTFMLTDEKCKDLIHESISDEKLFDSLNIAVEDKYVP